MLSSLLPSFGSSKPTVSQVLVYPIKSCAPISGLKEAKTTAGGFEYDRVAQVSSSSKDYTYCTPRDKKYAKLFHVVPTLDGSTMTLSASHNDDNKASAETISIDLSTPPSTTVTAVPMIGPKVQLQDYGDEVAKWLDTVTGAEDCRLTGIGPNYKRIVEVNPDQGDALPEGDGVDDTENYPLSLADEAPFLITSESSLQDLNKRLKERGKSAVDMRRFRPNIVLKGLPAWQEDAWKRIRIGTVEFHIWQRCGRCTMTTIDRDSLSRGPEPLATLSEFRERAHGMRNFGMHVIPVKSTIGGTIAVGESDFEVLEWDEERLAEWKEKFEK